MASPHSASAQDTKTFLESEENDQDKGVVENGTAGTTSSVNNEENIKMDPEWMDVLGSGQINKKVIKEGIEGNRPQETDVCDITFEGRLNDGTLVERIENYQIHLGDGEVIQGIDLVLRLMNEGEQAIVEIGPRFAYGPEGRQPLGSYPSIPGDETLTYTITLNSFQAEAPMEEIPLAERKKIGSTERSTENCTFSVSDGNIPVRTELPPIICGNRKRERGNWWYGRGQYSLAINCYRRALDYLDEAVGGITVETKEADAQEEEALKDLLEDRLKVYNNLAAAQLKVKALDAGLSALNNVLRCQPDNVKAIYRKAMILAEKEDFNGAIECLQRANALEPNNKQVKFDLQAQKAKAKEASQKEKNLYRKMLGVATGAGSSSGVDLDREGANRSKLIPWGMVFGSVAVVLAGMVAYRYKFI